MLFNIEHQHDLNKLWVNKKLILKNPWLTCFYETQNLVKNSIPHYKETILF